MGSIKTLNDNFGTEALNPPTQARYPSLMHFFKCAENGTGSTLTDAIGNVVAQTQLPGTLEITGDGTKIADPANIALGSIQSGTYADFTGKDVLLCYLCTKAAGNNLSIGAHGDAGEGGIRIANANNIIDDGTTECKQTGNPTTGTDEMTVIWSDFSAAAAGTKMGWCDASALTKVGEAGDGTALTFTGIGTTSFDIANITNMYGIAIFAFDNVPSDQEVENAIIWMRERWLAGEKVIYPGWLGRT